MSLPTDQMAPLGGLAEPAGPPMTVYQPSPEDQAVLSDVQRKYQRWREDRRPYEAAWFVNAAFYRGQQYVEYNANLARLTVPKAPPHRVRLRINKLQAKIRSRISKLLKNRPKPIVVPATNEYQDYLNAKATQRVRDYFWREQKLLYDAQGHDPLWSNTADWEDDLLGRHCDPAISSARFFPSV